MTLGQLARRFGWGGRPVLPSQEAYALWADSYPPTPHNPLMRAEQAVMERMLFAARPRRALDVGTGTGRYRSVLASAGATTIVGVDLCPQMLEHGQDRSRTVCADALSLPFASGGFDLVCSSLMLGDIEDLGTWIREASRVLAPDGHLVYSDFHPTWKKKLWRRTFSTTDGREFELPFHPHGINDHVAHLERASLVVRAIREPRMSDTNGRLVPVVVVFHAVRAGQGR